MRRIRQCGHCRGRLQRDPYRPAGRTSGSVPPTGRTLDLPYCDVFRVENGRVVSHHIYYDQVMFLAQLGLLPAPSAT